VYWWVFPSVIKKINWLWGLQVVAALQSPEQMPYDWKVIEKLRKALTRSEYQVDKLLAAL
jgi:hypothetical protein